MTSLFDGQAASQEMQAARAHLKSCALCKRAWSHWSRTRSLLRAATYQDVPVPLLEKVLLSCRLIPTQNEAAQRALDQTIAHEELARYLQAPDAEYAEVFGSPLAGFFAETVAPNELKNQILQAIAVEAATEKKSARKNAAPGFAALGFSVPQLQTWTEMARSWSAPRWGLALAAPAVVASLVMIAQPEDFAAAPADSTPNTSRAVASLSAQNTLSDVLTGGWLSALLKSVPKNTVVKTQPKIAAAKPAARSASDSLVSSVPADSSLAPSLLSDEGAVAQPATPRLISAPLSSGPLRAASIPPATQNMKIIRPRSYVPIKLPGKKSPAAPRWEPALGLAHSPQPGLMRASYSRSANSFQRLSSQGRQVSNVENAEMREVVPSLADAQFAAADFDQTLESVGQLSDDRPEDWGQAVDAYRASLMDEEGDEDWEDEDSGEPL